MFRVSTKLQPRVPYRPFTMYEEAVGLTGAQKISRVLLAINGFCIFTSIGIWALSSSSRHSEEVPAEVQRIHTEHLREKNDEFLSTLYGAERRDRFTKLKYSSWNGPPGSGALPSGGGGPGSIGMGGGPSGF